MKTTDIKRQLRIRIATPEDAARLVAIYAPYVENTSITFEYIVPSPEEFADRIRHTLTRYPYLVAELDGEPAGYAYASFQRLGKLYDPETAMRAGTVFPELNITLDEYERGLYNGV